MAKMFYTLEEAAAKMGVTPEKVREMASSGQLSEFRDRDRLVFKVEQVDLLAGGEVDEDTIPLADSGAEIALASDESKAASGSGGPAADASTKDRSGISIFEGEDGGETDASAQTQITASVGGMPMGDPGASGSGLLDVTKAADDTSLNAGLLEDVYQGGGGGSGDASADQGGGGLFESTGVASDVGAAAGVPAMAMMMAEPYDGAGSGLAGGLALAMVVILGVALTVALMAVSGATGFALTTMLAGNLWMYVGIFAAVAVVLGVVGMLIGKKS
ncbi:MAG: helix-turn-helix domain-containing protein [Phycisphaerales bacterium]|nr:helix-turn-helix domain-containing protein [Phycisphaerales bacterium]